MRIITITVICIVYTTLKFIGNYFFLLSEISRLQAGGSKGMGFKDPIKYVDVYRERPIRLTVRVLVPVREHPKVSNFIIQCNFGKNEDDLD